MKKWFIISALVGGFGIVACGGAEMSVDDNPGEGRTALKTGADVNFRKGEFDADVDVNEYPEGTQPRRQAPQQQPR